MTHARITIGSMLLGMVAMLAIGALLLGVLSPSAAAPAASSQHVLQAAGAAATATPAAASGKGGAPADSAHYADLLVQNFATQLGVDTTRLNSAFTAAANATIDQAVHDGKLSADQATKAKAQVSEGLGTLLVATLPGAAAQSRAATANPAMDAANGAVVPALAGALGMDQKVLMDALQSGKSLQSLEQAHNVTHAQVTAAVLAAVHSALAAGVQQGTWGQGDADKINQLFSANIDAILAKTIGAAGGAPPDATQSAPSNAQEAAFTAAGDAVAGLFGMQFDAMTAAIRNGQTTLLQLEQAHNVTEQQVADKALTAAQSAVAAGVQNRSWTQADAAPVAQDLNAHIYDYLAKFRNAFEMPALIKAAQGAVAPLFGMTADQLLTALQDGQTLPALEQAHHVSDLQVRDAVKAAGQARLAAGVQAQEWTAAQAADAALVFQETLDELVTGNLGAGVKGAGVQTGK